MLFDSNEEPCLCGVIDGHLSRCQELGLMFIFVWVPQKQTLRQGFENAKSSFGSDSRKHDKKVGKRDEEESQRRVC